MEISNYSTSGLLLMRYYMVLPGDIQKECFICIVRLCYVELYEWNDMKHGSEASTWLPQC